VFTTKNLKTHLPMLSLPLTTIQEEKRSVIAQYGCKNHNARNKMVTPARKRQVPRFSPTFSSLYTLVSGSC